MEGFEADDLIHTYARAACKDDCWVNIVSVDKDLLQLAGHRIHILADLKVSDLRDPSNWIDEAKVQESWEVKPSQIGDLLALAGDSVDNIPGVPGVGNRKAAALLKRYNDLDGIFDAARHGSIDVRGVGPKLVRNLIDHELQAKEMRKLTELFDVPGIDPSAWRREFLAPAHDHDWTDRAKEFLRSQDMASLAGRLERDLCEGPVRPVAPRPPPAVARVEDAVAARRAMEVLRRHCRDQGRLFSVSVEVPGDGARAICFSVFGGDDLDFWGSPRLWVDLMGSGDWAESSRIMDAFGEFFEDNCFQKVYHCFSESWRPLAEAATGFNGRVPDGFAGDTMHMSRLLNPSLKSYELENVCVDLAVPHSRSATSERRRRKRQLRLNRTDRSADRLQLESREDWVLYVTSGAVALHAFNKALRWRLQKKPWTLEGPQGTPPEFEGLSMWDCYLRYWMPLGPVLLSMELRGMPVDRSCLDDLEDQALREIGLFRGDFMKWVAARAEEAHGSEASNAANLHRINLNSSHQLSHLLFGPEDEELQAWAEAEEMREAVSPETEPPAKQAQAVQRDAGCEIDSPTGAVAAPLPSEEELKGMRVDALKCMLKERGLAVSGKKAALVARLLDPHAKPARQRSSASRVKVTIPGLGLDPPEGFVTKLGRRPQVSMDALQALATQRGDSLGRAGVEAIRALISRQEVEAVLSGFLRPLRSYTTADGRVHAYINLNTETGRLSSRQPNLMGEPAGKSVPLRKAFAAPPGKKLIVADYGQLELRVLAHLADCKSMVDLLCAGGDIHSRTAHLMFEEVRDAVSAGRVVVDASWPGAEPGAPLVKDEFPEERRRAKVLNFSVLYGKTAYTLAREWEVSTAEAEDMIARWYGSFPEVRAWKAAMEQATAARTLFGRERPLRREPDSLADAPRRRRWQQEQHMLRAASNTPVQGSAADIVVAAMLRVEESPRLRELGYRQLLQVHDEIILEGPEEQAAEALQEVIRLMEDPLPFKLRVPLKVDARHAASWYEGKL